MREPAIKGLTRCSVKVAQAAALKAHTAAVRRRENAREKVIARYMGTRCGFLWLRRMGRPEAAEIAEEFENRMEWRLVGLIEIEAADELDALCSASCDGYVWLGPELAALVTKYAPTPGSVA